MKTIVDSKGEKYLDCLKKNDLNCVYSSWTRMKRNYKRRVPGLLILLLFAVYAVSPLTCLVNTNTAHGFFYSASKVSRSLSISLHYVERFCLSLTGDINDNALPVQNSGASVRVFLKKLKALLSWSIFLPLCLIAGVLVLCMSRSKAVTLPVSIKIVFVPHQKGTEVPGYSFASSGISPPILS